MKGLKTRMALCWAPVLCLVVAVGGLAQAKPATEEEKPWVAPDDARKVKNPVPPTADNLAAAAQLFGA